MAYIFGDSFDCYATNADMIAGYWDSGTLPGLSAVGRFSGSQSISNPSGATGVLVKSSGANDAVHHIVCAYRQTATLTGTSVGFSFQFQDGATSQCSIVFRSDGAILLTSGGPTGTTLATYSGAVSAQSTWFAFEFEVVISNTVGSFTARKNGNTSNDFTLGSLNTRTTANNYANRLAIGATNAISSQFIDDLLWRSDTSSVSFVGDIRCYTRMPTSDASAQFTRSVTSIAVAQTAASSTTSAKAANAGMMSAFTAPYSGTIASGTVQITTGGTGNMKAAIYDATRATVLATSNAVVNPTTGANAITFGTPLTVTKGTVYYLAVDQDFSITYTVTAASQFSFTTTYASFPAASPTTTGSANGPVFSLSLTTTVNSDFVNEAQQDGTTTYVYDSTVGHADLYNIASITATPASTVAVTARAFAEKLDAGLRQVTVQIKSGATTVQATPVALATNFGWIYRTDTTDPATSAAWTPAAVNALQIGPLVTA